MMNRDAQKLRASSDMYQMLSHFMFLTTPHLAEGLSDGSVANDLADILNELEISNETACRALAALQDIAADQMSEADLLHTVRRDYTRLFTNPQISVMTPYQARFLGTETGSLNQRGRIPRGVASFYEIAGFSSVLSPKERGDHMGVELEFMSAARAMQEKLALGDDKERAKSATEAVDYFVENYFGTWAQDFFRTMGQEAQTNAYKAIAAIGESFLSNDLAL